MEKETSRFLGTAMALTLPCLSFSNSLEQMVHFNLHGKLSGHYSGHQSTPRRSCSLTFVVFGIQGRIWICSLTSRGDDGYADDGIGLDGGRI